MHDYKIYYLSCPKTYEVRYVGVTMGTISRRLSQHYYEGSTRKGTYKINWIKSLLNEGLKPNCCVVEHCSDENWEEREIYHISLFSNLTNKSKGGAGVVIDRTTTSIQRSANAKKIPIVQLTEEGELVKEWTSVVDAQVELGYKSPTSIANVLKKGVNLGHGFRWMYSDDYYTFGAPKRLSRSELAKEKCTKHKGVDVYDLQGNLLHSFNSQTECGQFLNFPYSSTLSDAIQFNSIVRDQYIVKNKGESFSKKRDLFLIKDTGKVFLNKNQLAKYLDCSPTTITNHFNKGDEVVINDTVISKY